MKWVYRNQMRIWHPYVSPYDPCRPKKRKVYFVPPQLYLGYQPMRLQQNPPSKALRKGTLWPILYSPYPGPKKGFDYYES